MGIDKSTETELVENEQNEIQKLKIANNLNEINILKNQLDESKNDCEIKNAEIKELNKKLILENQELKNDLAKMDEEKKDLNLKYKKIQEENLELNKKNKEYNTQEEHKLKNNTTEDNNDSQNSNIIESYKFIISRLEYEKNSLIQSVSNYKIDITECLNNFDHKISETLKFIKNKITNLETKFNKIVKNIPLWYEQANNDDWSMSIEQSDIFNPNCKEFKSTNPYFHKRSKTPIPGRFSLKESSLSSKEEDSILLNSKIIELSKRIEKRTNDLKICMKECKKLHTELLIIKCEKKELIENINNLKEKLENEELIKKALEEKNTTLENNIYKISHSIDTKEST